MANRRSVLIGLGGLVAGGGALLGTGAFTTVEAERTVSIETAGDADAFLGLLVDDDYDVGDDGIVALDLGGDNAAEGDGLLLDALTTYEPMLVVQNNGSQNVDSVEFEFESESGPGIVDVGDVDGNEFGMEFDFHGEFEGENSDGFDDGLETNDSDPSSDPLEPGEAAAYDLRVDTRGSDLGDDEEFDVTVTITVEAGN